MTKFSILDLAPVTDRCTPRQALLNAGDLAQHAEKFGYHRYWMAEHHNMKGIASAATAVALGYVASQTEHIRIGSGGVMLPNHAPYMVAEQFGTLDALYPGRVDLGLGRAPGTDGRTMRALRRKPEDSEFFPADVEELLGYLWNAQDEDAIKAIPGFQQQIPIWLLGSSLFGAQLAAKLGLPYAFASHFAPDMLHQALKLYRQQFQPSAYLQKPYAMALMNVFAADDERHARRMMTSMQQQFVALGRGNPGLLPAPVDDIRALFSPHELARANHALSYTAVGTRQQIQHQMNMFIEDTAIDELMLTCHAYHHEDRITSLRMAAEALNGAS
ncbi:LLM class flavin-dependent oxidoreductase [Aliidiomarina minuta]|uniref:Luciferase-like monooxygenase n=1 Tax=Aliidiomarina minuta TaxID=880057 RepID=A0A432W189_9GAMM|nr:LLM class flavin-dependent oxidoreductase [Aliidiomarina minuta]RUO22975.1 LLM class flavin-dependent oxidoreductase [Aliidiomarina minuta]